MTERGERQPTPAHIVSKVGYRGVFSDLDEAVAFIARYDLDDWFLVSPLEAKLQGKLEGEEGSEVLHLTSGRRSGGVPRHYFDQQEGVGVSTDRANFMHLIVHIDEWESNVFDRGLVWVDVTNPESARLDMHILSQHGLTNEELCAKIKDVYPKVFSFINGILDGNPFPPYSQKWPSSN